jgi:late competence protein required for DNA uptake (superfamily II DNA/RNA helicase)
MPDSNEKKFIVKLVSCSRCGNAFMINDAKKELKNLVCDNCIKLEQRKKILSESVLESQKETESNIKEFKDHLRTAKSQQIKQLYFEKIKEQSDYLSKSIELLKKIEETNDEKYIEEYKKLFEKMKNQ